MSLILVMPAGEKNNGEARKVLPWQLACETPAGNVESMIDSCVDVGPRPTDPWGTQLNCLHASDWTSPRPCPESARPQVSPQKTHLGTGRSGSPRRGCTRTRAPRPARGRGCTPRSRTSPRRDPCPAGRTGAASGICKRNKRVDCERRSN